MKALVTLYTFQEEILSSVNRHAFNSLS